MLTLSTYYGVDYFLTRQAKDNVTASSKALMKNIEDFVVAQDKAIEDAKKALEKENIENESITESKAVIGSDIEINSISKFENYNFTFNINHILFNKSLITNLKSESSQETENKDDGNDSNDTAESDDSESEIPTTTPSITGTDNNESNDDSDDSDVSDDDLPPIKIDETVWKINNDHLALGLVASLYNKSGKLLSTSEKFQIVDYKANLNKVYLIYIDDGNLVVLNKPIIIRNQTYYLQVIKEMKEESDFLHLLLMALIIVDLFALVFAFLTGFIISRRMLKPISSIIDKAKSISTKDLHQRIAIHGPNDELRSLATTINEMLARLESSFDNQARFVSDASHELRTPVHVIQGYSRMLERWGKDDPYVIEEAVSAIHKESENMTKLIENLLFLARGDVAAITLNKEKFNVKNLLAEIFKETKMIDSKHQYDFKIIDNDNIDINFFQPINGHVNISQNENLKQDHSGLDMNISSDIQANMESDKFNLFADKVLIKQMLRAVVDNSIKYTPEQGEISIYLERTDENISISIKDTGIGIPNDMIPKLFDRFYRVDNARSKATGGTGLGLSIVKWIADAHNGEVAVFSNVDNNRKADFKGHSDIFEGKFSTIVKINLPINK